MFTVHLPLYAPIEYSAASLLQGNHFVGSNSFFTLQPPAPRSFSLGPPLMINTNVTSVKVYKTSGIHLTCSNTLLMRFKIVNLIACFMLIVKIFYCSTNSLPSFVTWL